MSLQTLHKMLNGQQQETVKNVTIRRTKRNQPL
jgi:hypothetical protein